MIKTFLPYILLIISAGMCFFLFDHARDLHVEIAKLERDLVVAHVESEAAIAAVTDQEVVINAIRKARDNAQKVLDSASELGDADYYDTLERMLQDDKQNRSGDSAADSLR